MEPGAHRRRLARRGPGPLARVAGPFWRGRRPLDAGPATHATFRHVTNRTHNSNVSALDPHRKCPVTAAKVHRNCVVSVPYPRRGTRLGPVSRLVGGPYAMVSLTGPGTHLV